MSFLLLLVWLGLECCCNSIIKKAGHTTLTITTETYRVRCRPQWKQWPTASCTAIPGQSSSLRLRGKAIVPSKDSCYPLIWWNTAALHRMTSRSCPWPPSCRNPAGYRARTACSWVLRNHQVLCLEATNTCQTTQAQMEKKKRIVESVVDGTKKPRSRWNLVWPVFCLT